MSASFAGSAVCSQRTDGICTARHDEHSGLSGLQVAAKRHLWNAARNGAAAVCMTRSASQELLAIMIVGEMRDMHTEKGLNAVENLLATLDGNQSVTQRELFVHVSVGDTKPHFSKIQGVAPEYKSGLNWTASTEKASLAYAVQRLKPAWWLSEDIPLSGLNMSSLVASHALAVGICDSDWGELNSNEAVCSTSTPDGQALPGCIQRPANMSGGAYGLYGKHVQCARCDAHRYWNRYARLLGSFYAMVQREETCALAYSWIMRLRTDLWANPTSFPSWPTLLQQFNGTYVYGPGSIGDYRDIRAYVGGFWPRRHRQYRWSPMMPDGVPQDAYALVRRCAADAFFAFPLRTLRCVRRNDTAAACGSVPGFPAAHGDPLFFGECSALKVQLSECIGRQHVMTIFAPTLPSF